MKLNNNIDLKQVDDAVASARDDIFEQIDGVLSFLNPNAEDDPSKTTGSPVAFDQEGLIECADRVANVLDGLAELQALTVHRVAIAACMDKYGTDATIMNVRDALAYALSRRVTHLDRQTGPNRTIDAYGLLLASYLGALMQRCEHMHAADKFITPLAERLAPTIGETVEGIKLRLRQGDKEMKRLLDEAAFKDMCDKMLARGDVPPASIDEFLGRTGRSVPEDVARLAESLGISVESLPAGGDGSHGQRAMEPA
jgi:hypothetical protein